jgi:hypothetical protein
MSRARQVVFCRLVQYLPDGEALRSASLLLLRRRAEQAQLSLSWSEAQRMRQRLMGTCQRMLLMQLLWLLLQLLKLWLLLLLQLLKRESDVMIGVVCS